MELDDLIRLVFAFAVIAMIPVFIACCILFVVLVAVYIVLSMLVERIINGTHLH